MAMIPHGQPGSGAMILGGVARGFGGALWQGLRSGALAPAPPVTVHIPTGGMNAASAAAMTAIAAQVSAETAAFIERVTPYVKYSFYSFAIILCLVIVEKVYNGPVGSVIGAAARGLLAVIKMGAPVGQAGARRFVKAVGRLLRALYALPGQTRDAILERVVEIQNYVGHKVRTVREGLVAVHGYLKRGRNAVVGTLRQSLARVRTAGVRVRTAVVGFRGRRLAKRASQEANAQAARNQKIRGNLAAINARVVAVEEKRVKNLINKVKKSSAPLTAKERREYLALARKSERVVSSANRNAARVLTALKGRRSH